MLEENCSFCAELEGSQGSSLWPRIAGKEVPSRIVAQNRSYITMATIGPVIRGHCVIVPSQHRKSMAACDVQQRDEASEMLHIMSSKLCEIYGTYGLLLEHGAKEGSICKPCSVDHAHWHLVPTKVRATELLLDDFRWQRVPDPFVLPKRDYLLVGDVTGEYWVSYPEREVQSQILRKRLAFLANDPEVWDWRSNPRINLMLDTIRDLCTRLS